MFLLASAAPALADRAMSTRFSANDNGNITFAANSLMVCQAAAAGCTAARNTPPISSGTNNALNNNNYNMQYVNTAPGDRGRRGDVRFLVVDARAALDGDRPVRRPLLGRGHERRLCDRP